MEVQQTRSQSFWIAFALVALYIDTKGKKKKNVKAQKSLMAAKL